MDFILRNVPSMFPSACVTERMLTDLSPNHSEEQEQEKNITDMKRFWKTVKACLSDKSINSHKIHINENGQLIKTESKTAELLNNFFLNIVKNLEITELQDRNSKYLKY